MALDYAYSRHKTTNCSLFWIRGDSEDLFAESYGDIASEANLPETLTGNDKLRAVRRWIEGQKNWFVVIDNADDLDDPRSRYLEYVPRHQACSITATGAILWTTRDSKIFDLPYFISGGIDASDMQRRESLLLFRKLLHRAKPMSPDRYTQPASEDEARLLDELGDLPLAISQAAAYIRKNGNIRNYVDRLSKSESEAWKLLLRDQNDPYRHHRQNSVMKTWIVSLSRLKEEKDVGPKTLQIIYTVAFLDNQGITHELLQKSVGASVYEDDILDAIARLVEYSFLQYQENEQEGSRIYSQHKLFSMAMRHYLSDEGSRPIYAEHAFSIILQCFPVDKHKTVDRCSLYVPHALKVLTETGCCHFQQLADQLLPRVAFSYTFHGRYKEARAAIQQFIELQDQLPGKSETRKLEAQSALGWTMNLQGEYEEAEKSLESTLNSQKKLLDKDDPALWLTTTHLARAAQKNGNYDKAEALQLQILNYHKQSSYLDLYSDEDAFYDSGPPPSYDTLMAMNNLALTYRYQGRLSKAEAMFKEILAHWEMKPSNRPFLALTAQNNLSLVLRDQNRLCEAERLLKSTIKESARRLGNSHPDTISSMASLFSVYIREDRLEEAEGLGAKVEELSRAVLGETHPLFLATRFDMMDLQRTKMKSHHSDEAWDDPKLEELHATHPRFSSNIASNVAYGRSRSFLSRSFFGGKIFDPDPESMGFQHASTRHNPGDTDDDSKMKSVFPFGRGHEGDASKRGDLGRGKFRGDNFLT